MTDLLWCWDVHAANQSVLLRIRLPGRASWSTLGWAVSGVAMAGYRNAASPVMACPMISVWTSSVPSYVRTLSRLFACRSGE